MVVWLRLSGEADWLPDLFVCSVFDAPPRPFFFFFEKFILLIFAICCRYTTRISAKHVYEVYGFVRNYGRSIFIKLHWWRE